MADEEKKEKENVFELPKEAAKILTDRLKYLKQKSSDIYYLCSCLYAEGYTGGSEEYFMQQRKSCDRTFESTMEFLADRGKYPNVPSTKQPEIDFTDLNSGILWLLVEENLERKELNNQTTEIFGIDQEAYGFLSQQLQALKYNGDSLRAKSEAFEDMDESMQRASEKDIFNSSPSLLQIG